ncbi:hypothetical protein N657DRAFT_644297 [Parathielavia appendiculata]|uniref:Uncharacterized protein n=1 Tax=Parathielavia appendiculata TaxID=2587402 RepID=A0AAN6Z3P2_9PEZI|nr:hypothetical protein N657DRAFT_644297 [Parathielavia appendiculata]
MVEIHSSAEEAAQAGVFGVLGEEPIRLGNPRDTAMIAKFRDVWTRHQSGSPSDQERDVSEFFTAIDDADAILRTRRAVAPKPGQSLVVAKGRGPERPMGDSPGILAKLGNCQSGRG